MAAVATAAQRGAAMKVRRAIQKVRVATPENFETLEAELALALQENTETLGSEFEKLQEEADKGLEVARKRIQTITDKRKLDEEKTKRPKELMKVLSDLVEGLEAETAMLKDAIEDQDVNEDTLPTIDGLIESLSAALVSYVKETAEFTTTHGKEMATLTTSLPTVAQEFAALNLKVATKKREADLTHLKAKSSIQTIKTKVVQKKLEAAKPALQAQLDKVEGFVRSAEKDLLAVEKMVYPFSRGKKFTEDELNSKAVEVEAAIEKANVSREAASDKSPCVGDDVDEAMRADLEKWLTKENKRWTTRLCQFQARIARCKQLLKTAHKEIQNGKNDAIVAEMKEQLIAEVESAMDVAFLDENLKEIEKEVEPFSKVTKDTSVDEMTELAEKTNEAIGSFKEAMASAKAALMPIEEGLDVEVKKKLTAFLSAKVKKPILTLSLYSSRLLKAEQLVAKYMATVKKNKIAELVAQLKPGLLEKVKNSTGDAIRVFEDAVKAAETDIEPFARGCKRPASEHHVLADRAAASVELAKTSSENARQGSCPIDDSLEDDVKKELEAALKPETRKSFIKIGGLNQRLRRCSQIVKSFRQDMQKNQGQRADKVKTLLLKRLRDVKTKQSLSMEDLFKKFSPKDGSIDEAAFQKFFKEAGADDEISPEERATVFKSFLKEGKSALTQEDITKLAACYYKVTKSTSLMDGLSVSSSKALKTLKIGQVVELIQGPEADPSVEGLLRVKVKTLVGLAEGWATIKGNAGTAFLVECDAPAPKAAPKEKENA